MILASIAPAEVGETMNCAPNRFARVVVEGRDRPGCLLRVGLLGRAQVATHAHPRLGPVQRSRGSDTDKARADFG